jgi:hypothetical protein
LCAVTADEVGAALDLGEQSWNVRGIVLQISVDQYGRGAPRALQSRIHGRALPGIALELDQADLRLERDALDRPIDRAVIDKNDFVIKPAQRTHELCLQDRHVLLFVEERYYDGDCRRAGVHNGRVR